MKSSVRNISRQSEVFFTNAFTFFDLLRLAIHDSLKDPLAIVSWTAG